MMHAWGVLTALALVLGGVGASPSPLWAAAPANDLFAGASSVTSGFVGVLDTTEATTDADDTQLNASCGAPATDASVWYALEGEDAEVVVDVSQSSYSAGILVGVGTEGNLTTVACGPGTVSFFAAAGTRYYILAIDDQQDGGGNGGTLAISITELQAPSLEITVDPVGTFSSRTGIARISGTYTCGNAGFVSVEVDASQRVGRFTILGTGYFSDSLCDGAPHPWLADVVPENGKFGGGKAMTVTYAYSCGPLECTSGYAEQTVQLRGGR